MTHRPDGGVVAAGIVVAVADRLDSLVGVLAAVGAPSATADPYGLQRAAYGMLQVGPADWLLMPCWCVGWVLACAVRLCCSGWHVS